jgi:hypothetical protein
MINSCFTNFKQVCAQAVNMYNTRCPHWALNFKIPQVMRRSLKKNPLLPYLQARQKGINDNKNE